MPCSVFSFLMKTLMAKSPTADNLLRRGKITKKSPLPKRSEEPYGEAPHPQSNQSPLGACCLQPLTEPLQADLPRKRQPRFFLSQRPAK